MENLLEALPFPKRAFTWFSALILLAMVYLFYYTAGYPYLKDKYESKLQPYKVIVDQDVMPLDITLKIPMYVSEFEVQWAYLEVENSSATALDHALIISLKFPEQENSFNKLSWLETYGEESYLESAITFQNPKPNVKYYARIPFLVENPGKEKKVEKPIVYINGQVVETEQQKTSPSFRHSQAFLYSFAKVVLLPPWSNGIILLLVLFCCYFIEESGVWNVFKENPSMELTWFGKMVCKIHLGKYDKVSKERREKSFGTSSFIRRRFIYRVLMMISTAASILTLLFLLIWFLFGTTPDGNLWLWLIGCFAALVWLILVFIVDPNGALKPEDEQVVEFTQHFIPLTTEIDFRKFAKEGFTLWGKGLYISYAPANDKEGNLGYASGTGQGNSELDRDAKKDRGSTEPHFQEVSKKGTLNDVIGDKESDQGANTDQGSIEPHIQEGSEEGMRNDVVGDNEEETKGDEK